MLDAGIDALALDAAYIRRRHLSGQIRILGKILEIPSAQRASLDVHARTQKNIHAKRLRFLAQRFSYLFSEGKQVAGSEAFSPR